MQLTSRFHFVVALGLPREVIRSSSPNDSILAQFCKRCACRHALLLGMHLMKSSGGLALGLVSKRKTFRPG